MFLSKVLLWNSFQSDCGLLCTWTCNNFTESSKLAYGTPPNTVWLDAELLGSTLCKNVSTNNLTTALMASHVIPSSYTFVLHSAHLGKSDIDVECGDYVCLLWEWCNIAGVSRQECDLVVYYLQRVQASWLTAHLSHCHTTSQKLAHAARASSLSLKIPFVRRLSHWNWIWVWLCVCVCMHMCVCVCVHICKRMRVPCVVNFCW